ncbi:hypothetical protein OIE52_49755 [Streptomyces canus]|uniref:hypothetical protein n=1 Tax=Streptomyces canus TaxID=58343 RepID=UPI002E2E2FEE|nr:hypothetical protein [Streptomyces canus]
MARPTAAAGSDARVCLRDQLAEAIASLHWQMAVMLSHAGAELLLDRSPSTA